MTVDSAVNQACDPRSQVCVPGFICTATKKGKGLKKAAFKGGLKAAGEEYDEPTIAAGLAKVGGKQVSSSGSNESQN